MTNSNEDLITQFTVHYSWGEKSSHVYTIASSEGLVLIDCGENNDGAWQTLNEALNKMGKDVTDITAVLLTHAHADHTGLVRRIWEKVDAKVYIHESELDAMFNGSGISGLSPQCVSKLLLEHGTPSETVESFSRTMSQRRDDQSPSKGLGSIPEAYKPLLLAVRDDDELTFGDVTVKIIHCPGHSQGNLVFWHADSGTLFSGDHVLHHLAPNPLITFPGNNCDKRTRSLPDFLASMEKLRILPAQRVLPAHGEPVECLQEEIDWVLRQHNNHAERIFRAMDHTPKTAFDLIPARFPRLRSNQLSMILSHVIGCLDTMVDDGRVAMEKRDGKYYYSVVNGR